MRKLILRNFLSPGDIVMLTSAVRDLHLCYPHQFATDVRTSCPQLWENNPHITPLDEEDEDVEVIDCHYPLIERCNRAPYHCLHGFIEFLNDHLKLQIKPTAFKGDIHISDLEKSWFSQVEELTGEDTPFWIVVAGGKYDFTIKWWSTARYQEVIDSFQGRILFVQVGERTHHHPALEGVIDLRGKTNLRQLVRLVYHSQGVVCGVTALMHLAAAVETKSGNPASRACVVIAGGREPVHWEAYPHHQFIHTLGALPCCQEGGCWKSRTVPLGDGDENDLPKNLCVDVVDSLPRCMDMITPAEVSRRVETFFQGATLLYLTRAQARKAQTAIALSSAAPADVQRPAPSKSIEIRLPRIPARLEGKIRTLAPRFTTRKTGTKRPSISIRRAFVTVTDCFFFPGTLATINSIFEFHPEAEIIVVNNEKRPLSVVQAECLERHAQLQVINSKRFERRGRHIDAWELKAYACHDLCGHYDVIIMIDSDCLLCSNVDAQIKRCLQIGGFVGGKDGEWADYDDAYRIYGISTPDRNPKYFSTSLLFCANTDENRAILKKWAKFCSTAVFNGTGPHPGHGDQGILNAILFSEKRLEKVELLENPLWTQHSVYWDSIIDFREGAFVNRSMADQKQRTFHCGGTEKFWQKEHRDKVADGHPLQTYPYLWFLTMLWFGRCRNWETDPAQYLPPDSDHLLNDLVDFLPQILQIYPPARALWSKLTEPMINRVLHGVPRFVNFGAGGMTELIELVDVQPSIQRFVEIGGYEGGSILTLALRFANRDVDFYSVESFMGNFDGTMDGHPLPSRGRFLQNLARFPSLRVRLIPGEAGTAATMFHDGSVDFVFIDGCHAFASVVRDIDTWIPKIASGGTIAGDDYDWEAVGRAVRQKFAHIEVTRSGKIWWRRM